MLTSVDQSLSGPSHGDLALDAQLIKPARSSALLEALVATIQKRRAPNLTAAQAAEAEMPASSVMQGCRQRHAALRDGQRPAGEGGLDILVAEDNEVNQMVFSQILAETDLTFEIVANGRKAVAAYGERQPKMILMDVSMPEMNGLEATGEIRATGARHRQACADHRRHRACAQGRQGTLPGSGHGRLPAQADQSARAAGKDRALVVERRGAPRRRLARFLRRLWKCDRQACETAACRAAGGLLSRAFCCLPRAGRQRFRGYAQRPLPG